MSTHPQFFCYRERPKHVELEGLAAEIYEVMRLARGFFARRMTAEYILARLMEKPRVLGTVPTLGQVNAALHRMRGLEVVEQDARNPKEWRIKK